jgi:hypothetical protein
VRTGLSRPSVAGTALVPRLFPPLPPDIKGRSGELSTLARTIDATHPARVALVGSGGSGKSMLAIALGHRMARRFGGRVDWFRVGAWDYRTLAEMLALRYGTPLERRALLPGLRALLQKSERLVVLDNHEDDRATARLLDELAGTPTTFVITARRCLLAGVLVFPVTAPLIPTGDAAFPRVSKLTRRLRWNALALDIADSMVASRAASASELASFLDAKGVTRVCPVDHEDDLPEVALLVTWAWARLSKESRRVLAVLSHLEGDHADVDSLARLARLGGRVSEALAPLRRWHLVQEPVRDRYAVHAVVRYAVARRTSFPSKRTFEHYVSLLERHPERFELEQTHLFAAMDYAQRLGDMQTILRVERLVEGLSRLGPSPSMAL